jgi:zinc protease
MRTVGGGRRAVGAAIAALTALAAIALAGCRPPPKRSFSFSYSEQHVQLRNGLRVVIAPDRTTRLVHVAVRYEVGSREDPAGKAGLAHLVEHLMFQIRPGGQGAPLVDFVRHATSSYQGYTHWDATHYMSEARADMLEWLLKIEAVRLSHGCETIPEREFLREREVVRNELRQRRAAEATDLLPAVLETVYPAGHAYARPVSGSDAEIAGLTRDDVCAFLRSYYAPERATLIVTGDVEVAATEAAVLRWFGRIAARKAAPRRAVAPIAARPRRITRDADISRSVLVVAWPMPPLTTPAGRAARIALGVLALATRALAVDSEAVIAADPIVLGGAPAPVFALFLELQDAGGADRALELVRKAARTARRGYHSWQRATGRREQLEDMDELRVSLKTDFVESVEALGERATAIADLVQFSPEVPFLSDQAYLAQALARIDALEESVMTRAMEETVQFDAATVILFRATGRRGLGERRALRFRVRSDEGRDPAEVAPQEASRPIQVTGELGVLAGAARFQLPNGLRVVLLPVRSMPIVAVRLVIGAGGAHGAAPGLAEMAAEELLPPERVDPLTGTGIGVGCSADADRTVCATGGINIYLDAMIEGLADRVIDGRYDAWAIERRARRERLRPRGDWARADLERQVLAALYGPGHPYARAEPDRAAWGRITAPAVRAFRDRHHAASGASLIVAGHFDPAEARRLVIDAFSPWRRGQPAPAVPAARPPGGPAHIGLVGQAGPQARIVIAYPAPAGASRREAARLVLTEMLRLRVERVRPGLGASYDPDAGREQRAGGGLYRASADVDSERAGEALVAMREAVASLRRGGPGLAADFARARRTVVSDLLTESTVSRELAARLGLIAAFDLPGDFYGALLRGAAAVSLADVAALVGDELRPEREVVAVLAARPVLARAFAEAGIASPRLIEPAGGP